MHGRNRTNVNKPLSGDSVGVGYIPFVLTFLCNLVSHEIYIYVCVYIYIFFKKRKWVILKWF